MAGLVAFEPDWFSVALGCGGETPSAFASWVVCPTVGPTSLAAVLVVLEPDWFNVGLGCGGETSTAFASWAASPMVGPTSLAAVFVAAGPGIKEGHQRDKPIHLKDVAPTLCHLLGLAAPRDSEGRIVTDILV